MAKTASYHPFTVTVKTSQKMLRGGEKMEIVLINRVWKRGGGEKMGVVLINRVWKGVPT